MGKRILLALALLAVSREGHAATLTEASIKCDQQLGAELDVTGQPHVYAQCTTFDAAGGQLRASRTYDVTNKLTAQQKSGVQTILQSLTAFAAGIAAVPTPAATP